MRELKLQCRACGYELTGLVRDAAPVVCPECAGETEHLHGQPLPDPHSVWQAWGAFRWWVLAGPGVVGGAVVLFCHLLIRLGLDVAGLGILIVLVGGWFLAGFCVVILMVSEVSPPRPVCISMGNWIRAASLLV